MWLLRLKADFGVNIKVSLFIVTLTSTYCMTSGHPSNMIIYKMRIYSIHRTGQTPGRFRTASGCKGSVPSGK